VTWQPARVLFPDVTQLLCDATRALLTGPQAPAYVGRTVPASITTAVVWNRVGGAPAGTLDTAAMACRCWAPTDTAVEALAAAVLAHLPAVATGSPVIAVVCTAGPTDLGTETSPMRQLTFDVTTRGAQL
jgi:hypothetical protein